MKRIKLINGEVLDVTLRDWLNANIGGQDSRWWYDRFRNELTFYFDNDATYFTMVHVSPEQPRITNLAKPGPGVTKAYFQKSIVTIKRYKNVF